MAIGIDPVLSNIVFTLNLFMHIRRPASSQPHENPSNRLSRGELPTLSVLLPLFNERYESIETTVRCLAAQTYPKPKLQVLFICEPDDPETQRNVVRAMEILKDVGLVCIAPEGATSTLSDGGSAEVVYGVAEMVISDGKLRMKPYSLNQGLKKATGDIVCVYDADDRFDERQLEDAVTLMLERDYDVVQPRIFRSREGLLGSFLTLDSFVWNRKFLPTLFNMAGVVPLSGEALFVRRDALEEVGDFPLELTEDAYLSILLCEKGKKFGLLDGEVHELGPRGLRSHFRQRIRWFRGYLTCLGRTLKAKISLREKLTFVMAFLAPITCAFSPITWALFITYWLTWAFTPWLTYYAPWMLHWLYYGAVYYWSAFLAYVGNPIVIFSYMHALAGTPMERRAPLALLVPLYWMFIGVAAIASFFRSTRFWGKTER